MLHFLRSSTVNFSVISRNLLILLPVVEFTSSIMWLKSIFGILFWVVLICLTKLTKHKYRMLRKLLLSVIGQIRLRCVARGKPNIFLTARLYEPSRRFTILPWRSLSGDPVKCKLWISFNSKSVLALAKWNSCCISMFLLMNWALFILTSWSVRHPLFERVVPKCFIWSTKGSGFPHDINSSRMVCLVEKSIHLVLHFEELLSVLNLRLCSIANSSQIDNICCKPFK